MDAVTTTALTLFTDGSALDRATWWSALAADERRRRAMEAARDHDPEVLWALTDAWLTLHSKRGAKLSAYTRRNYKKGVLVLLDAWRGLNLLRPPHDAAAVWLRRLESHRQKPAPDGAPGLKPATITVHLAAARTLYAALRWARATEADPFRDAHAAGDATPAWEKRAPYSPAELEALLAVAPPLDRVLLLLGAHCGLRAAEIVAVRWAEVDLDRGALRVSAGKGGKQRTVPLSRTAAAALRQLASLETDRPTAAAGDYVLPFRSTKEARRRLARLCQQAGITQGRGVHALRHTAGTKLMTQTRDLDMVARFLGHSSVETARVYAKWSDESLRATVGEW